MKMKIYLPLYYKDFKCIAERCRHSCCIGWKIAVDEATLERYEGLPDGKSILRNIQNGEITLCRDGRCPFLRPDGLCQIIADYGEDFTSEVCREHPRFYHRVGKRIEGGIGASCEEAARIVLSSDSYTDFVMAEWCGDPAEETDLDTLSYREAIYSILLDGALSYGEKLLKIRAGFCLTEPMDTAEEWNEILLGLEYLDDKHRGRLRVGKSDCRAELQPYFERFFAYLVFRHVSIADSYDNLRARIGFCLLLTRILENLTAEGMPSFEELVDFVRLISEEIEYSEDNTDALVFEIECNL